MRKIAIAFALTLLLLVLVGCKTVEPETGSGTDTMDSPSGAEAEQTDAQVAQEVTQITEDIDFEEFDSLDDDLTLDDFALE